MPDTKITALAAITTVAPANDLFPIVDVSDNSMAASGTTKNITVNQLLGAGGTATLASATITGNLTVNGSYIACGSNSYIRTDAANLFSIQTGSLGFRVMNAGNSALFYGIDSASTSTWYDGAGGTRMTLNSTGLGVGGSPQAKIHGIGTGAIGLFTQGAAPAAALSAVTIQAPVASGFSPNPVLNFWYQNTGISNPASECFAIRTNSADRLYIDSAGNVGVGVTPSAWGTAFKPVQLTYGSFYSQAFTVAGISANCYNAGAGGWTYFGSGQAASRYEQSVGTHAWYTAAAGTGAIGTFTQAMTLDASGNLLVGTTSAIASGTSIQNLGSARQVLTLKGNDQTSYTLGVWSAATTGDNLFSYFGTETSLSVRGSIDYNRAGGLVRYNTTSDYRAKDIIGPVSNSGSLIDSLKVYIGKMKGATIERPMLIAHEAQGVAPYAVTGTKDEVDADGNPKYQQMDVSSLVPLLIAEIQSLRARVEALEA